MAPKWPGALHPQGVRTTGGKGRRPRVVPQTSFTELVRTTIQAGVAQGIVSNSGVVILPLGPQGIGTRWYPSQIQVATSSGPSDQSRCVLYHLFIDPKQQIGQTEQGGGDTLSFTRELRPGELVFAVWSRANPGDLASFTIHGDQLALAAL